MPIYEYLCKNCGHHLEEFQTMKEAPLTKCPVCGKNTLQRLIGAGSGIIFKGSGFYETDYKRSHATRSTSKKPAVKSEKTAEKKAQVRKESSKETKPDKSAKPEQKK